MLDPVSRSCKQSELTSASTTVNLCDIQALVHVPQHVLVIILTCRQLCIGHACALRVGIVLSAAAAGIHQAKTLSANAISHAAAKHTVLDQLILLSRYTLVIDAGRTVHASLDQCYLGRSDQLSALIPEKVAALQSSGFQLMAACLVEEGARAAGSGTCYRGSSPILLLHNTQQKRWLFRWR